MFCPICGTGLQQHLLQSNLAIIACPAESCVYPFNLSVEELHEHNLILEVSTNDIMKNMESKMVLDAEVDPKLAKFISRGDPDIK